MISVDYDSFEMTHYGLFVNKFYSYKSYKNHVLLIVLSSA